MTRTNDLLCQVIAALEAQVDNEWSHVPMDTICASLDAAEPAEVTPIVVYQNGVYDHTEYMLADGTIVQTATVTLDPCGCPCVNCDCFASPTGEVCMLLRTDASPASISQGTLDGYTLEFVAADDDACSTTSSLADTGPLNTVDIGGGVLAIQNFADAINATLGGYGFRAVMCDDDGGHGTTPESEMIAVAGPTGAGSWEIKFNSGGSGDEFAIGWDDTLGQDYAREWVNGTELTDPSNSYHALGYWDAKNCGTCAP